MKFLFLVFCIFLIFPSVTLSENLLGKYFPVYVNGNDVFHEDENIYHFYKCDLLTSNKEMHYLSEAVNKGLEPCEVCQPPNKYDSENLMKVKLPPENSALSDSEIALQKKLEIYNNLLAAGMYEKKAKKCAELIYIKYNKTHFATSLEKSLQRNGCYSSGY